MLRLQSVSHRLLFHERVTCRVTMIEMLKDMGLVVFPMTQYIAAVSHSFGQVLFKAELSVKAISVVHGRIEILPFTTLLVI